MISFTPYIYVLPQPLPAHFHYQTPRSQAWESPPAGAGLPGALSRQPRSQLGTGTPDVRGLGTGEVRQGLPGLGSQPVPGCAPGAGAEGNDGARRRGQGRAWLSAEKKAGP